MSGSVGGSLHRATRYMHALGHMSLLRQHRPRKHRARHVVAAWLMLVLSAAPVAASSSVRYVCSMGMAQAGPSCPLCHGHDARNTNHRARPCCREVIVASPVAPAAALQTAVSPLAVVQISAVPGSGIEPPVGRPAASGVRRLKPIRQASSVNLRI